MICPHCERDTPPSEDLCVHCAGALDVTFDELSEVIAGDAEEREQWRIENRARALLALCALVFALVVVTRWLIVPTAPTEVVVPVLRPASYLGTDSGAARAQVVPLELPGLEPEIPLKRR
jgi:hypothetical protein